MINVDDVLLFYDSLVIRLKQLECATITLAKPYFVYNIKDLSKNMILISNDSAKTRLCKKLLDKYDFVSSNIPKQGYLGNFKEVIDKGLELNAEFILVLNYRYILSLGKHVDDMFDLIKEINILSAEVEKK